MIVHLEQKIAQLQLKLKVNIMFEINAILIPTNTI